jgi:hypothetical protein
LKCSSIPIGVPVAWMLSSNGKYATIQYFLQIIKTQSPNISPNIYMTDRDQAQVKAICVTYPCCWVLYCWWHILRAIWTYFMISAFLKLWTLIQDWVHTTDAAQFDAWWEQMQMNTSYPDTVIRYLAQDWVPCKDMWSAIFRQNCTIFEEGDTNILLEL